MLVHLVYVVLILPKQSKWYYIHKEIEQFMQYPNTTKKLDPKTRLIPNLQSAKKNACPLTPKYYLVKSLINT